MVLSSMIKKHHAKSCEESSGHGTCERSIQEKHLKSLYEIVKDHVLSRW